MGFQAFDSYEDMQAAMTEAREKADAVVTTGQAALKPGDLVIRHDAESGLVIYSELRDPVAGEREAGADDAEIAYVTNLYNEPHMRNFRFGKHFSEACPEGELGDLHVCVVVGIMDRAAFEWFRENTWPSDLNTVRAAWHTLKVKKV